MVSFIMSMWPFYLGGLFLFLYLLHKIFQFLKPYFKMADEKKLFPYLIEEGERMKKKLGLK